VNFSNRSQSQEKTVDDLWQLIRENNNVEEEDDGFGIADVKKKSKPQKKEEKLVSIF